MLDRQKVETILIRRFPGATTSQVAAAANSIMGLDDEWQEIPDQLGRDCSGTQCDDVCYLAREIEQGGELRLFRRRVP